MLLGNVKLFCERSEKYKQKLARYIESEDLKENECENILQSLCQFLMKPTCSIDVAECFPQYLLVLLTKAIQTDRLQSETTSNASEHLHRLNCVILGTLITTNPDVLGFTLRYFEVNPAPFDCAASDVAALPKRRRASVAPFAVTEVSTLEIVRASYKILQSAPEHFKHKWNWSRFYNFLLHENDTVKWTALKCVGIILKMSEATRLSCARSLIEDPSIFLVERPSEKSGTVQTTVTSNIERMSIVTKNLDSLVSISGVLLPVFKSSRRPSTFNLIPVPSMESNLRSLALAVASRRCICLQGAVGCGKTALVEYLAGITGHGGSNFVKVQLGDQTDSKMLLGTYRCTDIPGEFVWQPGVLTQAVLDGKWLLLEDIDSAALDVASVLGNLMETGTLSVPGYRDTIYAKSGFQLFLTQRLISTTSGLHRRSTGAANLLEKHWLCVHIESLTKDELVTVVKTLFSPLTTVATRMVEVFLLFSVGNHENENTTGESLAIVAGRLTSTRDLIKWCTRAIVNFEVSSPDSALKIFQDAIDIFCCSVPDQARRLELATAIGHTLGIVRTKAEYFCNTHKPTINLLPEIFVAGRAKVRRKKSHFAHLEHTRVKFSFTRPSATLLERVTSCVAQREPVLLVGETGTGKTSSVQYLARSTGHKLIVINMNQQSESADLLGGYKPVDFKYLITPTREEFEMLFRSYFALEPNKKFLEHVAACYKQSKWKSLVGLMCHSAGAAVKRLGTQITEEHENGGNKKLGVAEKRKQEDEKKVTNKKELLVKWEKLLVKLEKLKSQVKTHFSLAFAFLEGSLIKALQGGHWVLLDEINLASSETLECLSGLLEGSTGSLSLLERGDSESIVRHPDFTIFACMNPATDVGKKELPIGLRNRFTEFYVDELTEKTDLQLLVNSYLGDVNLTTEKQEAIVKMYLNVRKEAVVSLYDGTGHKPHYSLRTLCRALSVASTNPCGNVVRSLYEAFCLSFLTQLDHASYPIVEKMIIRAILDSKTAKAVLGSPIPKPRCCDEEDYTNFEGYWVIKGDLEPRVPENYILTNSVRRNLRDLVRVVSIGKMPVLLQGDTSVGKTSLITYLAKASGHTCVRINNHEHTDLQEYVGSYVADEAGKLIFKEGVLVEAMRKGHWIILDELNLAPSDVLEALNRVLDDNRELFIPETQQVVKAHANFMLFATQNPPGLYGGRKVLSRAFRNRFVELHFDEIPADELRTILHERCHMPESYCKQIISVMTDLQIRRKSTAAFQGKHGFITLRDLFRWGERYRLAPDVGNKLYDWSQHLADEGYLVLAAKVRKIEEAQEIREVIKKHLKRDVDPSTLFSLGEKTSTVTRPILEEILGKGIAKFDHVVWTYHMRRMAVLVRKSCQFKEPVLLVGETGGGKTTICQLIAAMSDQELYAVNCHMHTESSDFLGNLRPVRDHSDPKSQKLFEWVDGPLIKAMRKGDLFLADEISLADDSVLERLNSLLEPERSLLLTEKSVDSPDSTESDCVITANDKFHFIGTMNPGGDYGKKELSPALRNRFTEIWCEGCVEKCDLQAIVEHNLKLTSREEKEIIARSMLNFVDWLKESEVGKRFTVSIRDILTWVNFMNSCIGDKEVSRLSVADSYLHGACLTFIDSLGSGLTGMESADKLEAFRKNALNFLSSRVIDELSEKTWQEVDETMDGSSRSVFGIAPFFIPKGPDGKDEDENFTFVAPTTRSNTLKLLRALQLKKSLLLEGSPGVGKTSLVAALARASGHPLLRINLSDQTDVSDLFGADLPLEGGKAGQFAWKDGPFLRALRAGDWILLDELNLASQSVLEGLNACLDHRGEIYIPELGRTFTIKPGTKLFGCQNPLRQGGARRGLPKSFLNRFTQVYVDALSNDDLKLIATKQFPQIPSKLLDAIVEFNAKLANEAGVSWGHSGSPWEMNLRDITRWCEATFAAARTNSQNEGIFYNPGNTVELVYVDRMRTQRDRRKVREIYERMFSIEEYPLRTDQPIVHITEERIYLDDVSLSRQEYSIGNEHNLLLLRDQIPVLRNLARCVEMNWMPILVGGPGCGKSSVVRVLAQLTGQRLRSIVVNSAMDTTEILGGFEQTDYNRHLEQLLEQVESLLIEYLKRRLNGDGVKQVVEYHSWLENIQNLSQDEQGATTMAAETELFLRRTKELWKLVTAMKKLDDSPFVELQVVEENLRKLANNVKQDKCLNAGGKFEWVDSILVKCLQEGSWLLLDQVNLCSPAVLDRLNGLLEPGGVLTIGERGIASDGNILTIKPHKNFRLFLTMDPRYGEISRAMRNRGVEIYMLGHRDNCDNDNLDLRSMLFNLGLEKCNHQEALLEIHEKMSSEDFTSDKLSIVHLLHSAFLITQQISRGFSARESFRISCVDVYLKSRCVQQSVTKERLKSLIEDCIDRHNVAVVGETFVDLSAVTPRIRDLQDNSKLTIVRQQAFLLDAVAKKYDSSVKKSGANDTDDLTTSFINEFLAMPRTSEEENDVNIEKILSYLLLNFYERSSMNDVELRKRWLSLTLSRQSERLRNLEESSVSLAHEIAESKRHFDVKALPWDSEYLPNVANDDENSLGRANRLALVLYLLTMNIQYPRILEDISLDKTEKTISVSQYSSAVYQGKLTSHLKNQPLVTNFVIFIAQLNSCVNLMLRDNSVLLSSEDYVTYRKKFAWIKRFHALGQFPLIDKAEKATSNYGKLDEIILVMRVHYKWLVKFVKSLFDLGKKFELTEDCRVEIERLAVMIDSIDKSIASVHNPFRKIAKIMKNYLVMPLPFSSEIRIKVYGLVKKLSDDLAPCTSDSGDSSLKRDLKIILLQNDETMKIRAELINIWKQFYDDRQFGETTVQALHDMEEFCDRCHLRLRTPIEISEALAQVKIRREREIIDLSANVQLWPIYEYIFFLLVNNLHRKISEDRVIETNSWALEKLAKIPSLPINLIALLDAILVRENGSIERERLKPELFTRLDRFLRTSCAFNDSKAILHWKGIGETDMEKSITSTEVTKIDNPVYSPVLVNLVSELILNKAQTIHEKSVLATARLGTYRSHIRQLKTLNGVLWRNSVVLNSPDYDRAHNDRVTLSSCLKVFLAAEEKMTNDRDTSLIVQSEIQKQTGKDRVELEEKFRRDYVEPLNELKRRARAICPSPQLHDNDRVERSESWIILGYLQVFLFGNLGYIDPIHKISLKLRYVEEDIEDCRNTIYVATLNSRIQGDFCPSSNTHPRIIETRKCLERLLTVRKDLETCKAIRPSSTEFITLAKETFNFRNTLGSWEVVSKIMKKLSQAIVEFNGNVNSSATSVSTATDGIQEAEIWQESLQRFSILLENKFSHGYPDIVIPLLTAVAQLKHGIRGLSDETRRLINLRKSWDSGKTVQTLMHNLVRFPTIGEEQRDLLSLVETCTSPETRAIINENINNAANDAYVSLAEQFRMVKNGLFELYNHITLEGNLDIVLWTELNVLLQQIVLIWQRQRDENERRDLEKDSMYKNKVKIQGDCPNEEKEIARELRNLFPTSRHEDFTEIEEMNTSTLEHTERITNDEEEDPRNRLYAGLVTEEDVNEVHEIHSRIVKFFVKAPWMKKQFGDNKRNYVEPLIQRYNTFGLMLEKLLPAMDCRLSTKLYASLNFLTSITVRTSEGQSEDDRDPLIENASINQKKSYDYYKSSNVEEAKQCLPLLEIINDRVDGFLKEWPEHPTLQSIRSIIARIYGFSITSPISRFLTGLELLLVKMKEWEENAHSGVSLCEYSLSLTQQIISWRRLELACWKDCLNTAHERLRAKASKWWFFLYALVESYVTRSKLEVEIPTMEENVEATKDDEPVTAKKLTELLEAFINGSSLVEFQSRLDLLMTFHSHAYHLNNSKERDELLAILWNVHNYYKQYSFEVDKKIKSFKAPIEKKLRDFVKIARWNDINYWSVKETVEKTHRTLHKFIREYETGLKVSVVTCLLIKPTSYSSEADKGEWDRPKERDYSINPKDFLDTGKIIVPNVSHEVTKNYTEATELVSRMESLLKKAKHLCEETILLSSYPGLRVGLEELMENMIAHSTCLKNMEVDRTLPKPKQKSHAKSILQQKKMALADYFKTLSHIGLSYRSGALAWKNRRNEVIDLTVPPIDLFAALDNLPRSKVDKQMLAQWDGCESYYYKSLIKLNALNVSFTKTQSDLGLSNMGRCSGYSTHIMLMAHKQKRVLADSFDSYVSLRTQATNLSKIVDCTVNYSDRESLDCAKSLKKLLITLKTGFEQLELYLQACPTDPGLDTNTEILSLESSKLAIVNATRNDPVWESANLILRQCLVSLNRIVETHQKLFNSESLILTSSHHEFLNESNEILSSIKTYIHNFSNVFSTETEQSHPIVESVEFLEVQIDEWIEKFLLMGVSECEIENAVSQKDNSMSEYTSNLELLIKTMLLAIQRKYKETSSENNQLDVPEADEEEKNDEEEEVEEEDNNMQENGFREKLIESLAKDVNDLHLNEVHRLLVNVLKMTSSENPSLSSVRRALLVRCLPLLRQYLLFAQFYLNEQVGAFRVTCKLLYLQLNVFIDLATNGFCVPKDLDLEEGEGEESKEGKSQNGMGLGDGEGEKDVSDRIESEDQLEDARPADQEKDKQDDKDCKEEENGIDMSEDFDANMQDVEKKDNDENERKSEDEDDEELDKQMGDTEKGADALDEEIWGEDEDDSKENEEDKAEEDQGKGEEIGEKEMTAKDDSKKNNEDDERNQDGDRKEEEKKEINEIDEPEVNDDQIDPYHGNQQPPPEPEAMDLPDDINLDGEDPDDKPQGDEANPFDIDEMKECMPPPEKEEDAANGEEEEEKKEEKDPTDSSDEEDNDHTENGEIKGTNEDGSEDEQPEPEAESEAKTQVPEKKDEEEQDDEDKKEEEGDKTPEEKASASIDDASKEMDATDQPDVNKDGSRDKVADQPNIDDEQESTAENNEDDSNNRGSGNAQSEQQDSGHSGTSMQNTAPVQHRENEQKQIEKRKNPGESDENRSLVDKIQPDKKKLKMIHSREETSRENDEEGAEENEEDAEMDMCQHVKNSEKYDDQAMDAATREQVKQQAVNKEEEEEKKLEEDEAMEIDMNRDEEESLKNEEKPMEQNSDITPKGEKDKERRKDDAKGNVDDGRMESIVEIEGDTAETTRVDRGVESAFFTNIKDSNEIQLSSVQVAGKRMEVETMLSRWTYVPSTAEALEAWNCLNTVVEAPARDLAEKLRLVLEPTQATRLKGDYRTGRRINMRKIIPYIASQFRKDKIWLRRTKPSKRDYQIVLALDDSSSMADNHSKELAFESLSLISKAMGYLEVGELSVMSFGETTSVLHPLGEPFTENSGSRLIQDMRFDQKKTNVGQLVDFTVDMFDTQQSSTDSAKLLVVLSDGRGVFSEGLDQVNNAVRRARLADIFLVFIIVDNPLNKDSILDIRMPVFQAGKLLGIKSYMDSFPFPFYMILRDINALPGVLSDALRQWFEVVGKIDT